MKTFPVFHIIEIIFTAATFSSPQKSGISAGSQERERRRPEERERRRPEGGEADVEDGDGAGGGRTPARERGKEKTASYGLSGSFWQCFGSRVFDRLGSGSA